MTVNFRDSHAIDAHTQQGFLDLIQLERLENNFHFLHYDPSAISLYGLRFSLSCYAR